MNEITSFEEPSRCPRCGKAPIVDAPPRRDFDYVECVMIYCCTLQAAGDSRLDALSVWNSACNGYRQALKDHKIMEPRP